MARACSICARDDRNAIDEAIVAGQPIRAIGRRFHASRDAIARHQVAHLSPALVKLQAVRDEQRGETLLERMETLIARTERLLSAAEESGAMGQALSAIDRMWKGYELVGKVTGEIKSGGTTNQTINVLTHPDVLRVIQAVRHVLADQPERLEAFSRYLELPAHES